MKRTPVENVENGSECKELNNISIDNPYPKEEFTNSKEI